MQISKEPYGTLKDGREVHLFTLVNKEKVKVQITNYGGIIVRFEVPDKQGHMTDIVLGKASYNIRKVQRSFQHAYDTLAYNNSNSVSLLKLIISCDPQDLKASGA